MTHDGKSRCRCLTDRGALARLGPASAAVMADGLPRLEDCRGWGLLSGGLVWDRWQPYRSWWCKEECTICCIRIIQAGVPARISRLGSRSWAGGYLPAVSRLFSGDFVRSSGKAWQSWKKEVEARAKGDQEQAFGTIQMIGHPTEDYALHEVQRIYDGRAALHARQSAPLCEVPQLRVLAGPSRPVAFFS